MTPVYLVSQMSWYITRLLTSQFSQGNVVGIMLTQKDIEEIKSIVREEIVQKTRLLPTRDEFFTKMDEVMGELKAIREEHAIQSDILSGHTDQIEEHEERIAHLEKPATL